jgi:hypothetical protein
MLLLLLGSSTLFALETPCEEKLPVPLGGLVPSRPSVELEP